MFCKYLHEYKPFAKGYMSLYLSQEKRYFLDAHNDETAPKLNMLQALSLTVNPLDSFSQFKPWSTNHCERGLSTYRK